MYSATRSDSKTSRSVVGLLLVVLTLSSCDSSPASSFSAEPSRPGNIESVTDAALLPDGSFVVVGQTDAGPSAPTSPRPVVLNFDADGSIRDTTVYQNVVGTAVRVSVLGSGLAVMVGRSHDRTERAVNEYVIYQTENDGERIQTLLSTGYQFFLGRSIVQPTGDGGIVYANTFAPIGADDGLRFNSDGSRRWSFRTPDSVSVWDVAVLSSGRIVILSFASDGQRFLTALDDDGVVDWEVPYAGAPQRIVAAGEGFATYALGSGSMIVLSRLDSNGLVVWEVRAPIDGFVSAFIGNVDGGITYAIDHTVPAGDEYWIEGYPHAGGASYRRTMVVRLDPDGSESWRRRFGPEVGSTIIGSLVETPDGRIFAVGITGPDSQKYPDHFDALTQFFD